MDRPPFVVMGLPRSRTAWLARFLTYGDWHCGHEEIRHARSIDDLKAWLSMPCTGTAETAAAPFWRLLVGLRPDVRIVTIRRPVGEVVDSLMAQWLGFDAVVLRRLMERLDAKLDQIEARVPGVLSVQFHDLPDEATCAKVFEHCLPYQHDPRWWLALDNQNIQISMPALMRYMIANREALDRTAAAAKRHILTSMPRRVVDVDGITIQQESCETWLRDGKALFREHSVMLGQGPEDYEKRNWPLMMMIDKIGGMQIVTGRCNGRMFGYCVAYIAPATDDATVMSSLHISIFCSRDFAGMGMKLQRASIEALRQRGVHETFFRAGVLAEGARMASAYKRLGAENIGQMYRLPLGNGG